MPEKQEAQDTLMGGRSVRPSSGAPLSVHLGKAPCARRKTRMRRSGEGRAESTVSREGPLNHRGRLRRRRLFMLAGLNQESDKV